MHPTLACILRDWIDTGWAKAMGREPQVDDLVIPLPATTQGPAGRMRTNSRTLKDLHEAHDLLGMRRRRVHDLRHTMISLTRTDGGHKDIVRRATHQPPKEVIEGYTHFEWDVVCREISKLNLDIGVATAPSPARAVPAPYVSNPDKFATPLATSARRPGQPQSAEILETYWRRKGTTRPGRESCRVAI